MTRTRLLAAGGVVLLFGVLSTIVAVASPWGGPSEEVDVAPQNARDNRECLTRASTADTSESRTGKDTDADGVEDILERFVCSDASDPNSLPEVAGYENTCTDGRDNDLNGETDGDDAKCSDRDSDEWPDALDNCPEIDNPDQLHNDEDGLGAECDPDDDGDGVPDEGDELCPDTPVNEDVDDAGCADSEVDGDSDGVCDGSAQSTGP
jgi:hypothetical protein